MQDGTRLYTEKECCEYANKKATMIGIILVIVTAIITINITNIVNKKENPTSSIETFITIEDIEMQVPDKMNADEALMNFYEAERQFTLSSAKNKRLYAQTEMQNNETTIEYMEKVYNSVPDKESELGITLKEILDTQKDLLEMQEEKFKKLLAMEEEIEKIMNEESFWEDTGNFF